MRYASTIREWRIGRCSIIEPANPVLATKSHHCLSPQATTGRLWNNLLLLFQSLDICLHPFTLSSFSFHLQSRITFEFTRFDLRLSRSIHGKRSLARCCRPCFVCPRRFSSLVSPSSTRTSSLIDRPGHSGYLLSPIRCRYSNSLAVNQSIELPSPSDSPSRGLFSVNTASCVPIRY